MRDGKALQMGTSHELGQNFARAFDITYLDESGSQSYVWQTSWGVSTRLMGALVMVHGDDDGLRIPPRLAPVQAVVVLARADDGAGEAAAAVAAELRDAGVRVELDTRTDTSFGRRVVDWELKGVPLRVEVGRATSPPGRWSWPAGTPPPRRRWPSPASWAPPRTLLDAIHGALFDEAVELRRTHTAQTTTLAEAQEAAATGFATVPLAVLGADGETTLNRAGISVRCVQSADGGLPGPGDDAGTESTLRAVVGRAY